MRYGCRKVNSGKKQKLCYPGQRLLLEGGAEATPTMKEVPAPPSLATRIAKNSGSSSSAFCRLLVCGVLVLSFMAIVRADRGA